MRRAGALHPVVERHQHLHHPKRSEDDDPADGADCNRHHAWLEIDRHQYNASEQHDHEPFPASELS